MHLNESKLRRVNMALIETRALIAKEERYQEKFQKREYLASLRQHEAKLVEMLKSQPDVVRLLP